jgi:crotonobetainyl-CoA:carnitine CoA-transferase CaiB-like acyl-CoA transferase
LGALEVPHAPLNTPPEVLASEQARELGIEVSGRHAEMGLFRTVRSPLSFDGARETSVRPPPVLGEHNQEVLGQKRKISAAE